MKFVHFTFLAFIWISTAVNSQELIYQYCFDAPVNCAGYQMSVPEPVLTIDNTPNNTWAIGQPQKNSFTSGYNSAKAMVTDSVNSYPSNNQSSFRITWTTNQPSNSIHWANSSLSFFYFVDSDTLTDYGTVELSPDNGATWINLLNDPTYGTYLDWGNGGPNGTIPPALSGRSNGWIESQLNMQPLFQHLALPAGTTIIWRFSFTSDGNQSNKDGLMFDNIHLVATPPLGLQEITENAISLFPNPVTANLNVSLSGASGQVTYRIYSSEGKFISQADAQSPVTTLDLHALEAGIYYLSVYSSDHSLLGSKKFVRQ